MAVQRKDKNFIRDVVTPNLTFNVDLGLHRTLIKDTRDALKNSATRYFTGKENVKYFVIKFESNSTGDKAIFVFVRRSDLYVVAITNCEQYVFNGIKVFKYDSSLPYGSAYKSLGGVENVEMSYSRFQEHVKLLITHLNRPDRYPKKWKQWMITVIVSVAEATRFHLISVKMDKTQSADSEELVSKKFVIGEYEAKVLHNWRTISREAEKYTLPANGKVPLTLKEKKMLLGKIDPKDSYLDHFNKIKKDPRLCRALVAICCNYLDHLAVA